MKVPGKAKRVKASTVKHTAITLESALDLIKNELQAAAKYPPMNSPHEGYAVILEELDELWSWVKVKQGNRDEQAMLMEAVQVAAMALRFILDISDGRAQR